MQVERGKYKFLKRKKEKRKKEGTTKCKGGKKREGGN